MCSASSADGIALYRCQTPDARCQMPDAVERERRSTVFLPCSCIVLGVGGGAVDGKDEKRKTKKPDTSVASVGRWLGGRGFFASFFFLGCMGTLNNDEGHGYARVRW